MSQDSEKNTLNDRILRYRTVFEAANDAIFVMDNDRFVECNPMTLDIFACKKLEDIIGHTPYEFSPLHQPDGTNSKEKALILIEKALKGEPQRFYWKHIRKNGDEFDAEVSLNSITIQKKTLLFAIVRDITERKMAEASIKNLYLRNKAILASVPDVIMEVDKNKVYTWANQAGLEFFGQDVVGKEAAEYFIGDQQTYQKVQPLFEGEESVFYVESWQRRRDGEKRLLAWWCRALKDDRGEVTGALSTARDITAQKEAEETLREREKSLQSIFRAAPIGIGVVSDRVLLRVNDNLCQMLGYEPEELIGQSARIVYPSEEEFEWVGTEKYQQIKEKGTGTVETQWQRKDGKVIDILLSSTPLNLEDLSEGVTFTALDITERKKEKAELERTRALLTAAVQQSPAGILIADAPDVTIRVANAAALGIRGGTVETLTEIPVELHPANWQTYYPNGELFEPENLPLSKAILKGETCQNVEAIIRRQDGSDRWVLANAAPVRDAEGKVIAGVVVFPDITDRKIAAKNLEESEQRFRSTFEQAAVGIAHVAPDGRFLRINKRFCDIVGYTIDEMLQKTFQEITYPEDLPKNLQMIKRILDDELKNYSLEKRYFCKDGSIVWVNLTVSLLKDSDDKPKYFISVVEDITARKNAEEMLQDTAEKLKLEHKAVLEKNIALKQILDHMETEKKNFKQEIGSNIYELIYPIILELQKTGGHLSQKRIDLLENSLKAIIEKDIEEFKINYSKLTPREMDVCELIGKGLSSKEIAESLTIASETVNKHRESIRRKLQIKNKNINLSAYLRSKLK
jgi:PAS domain S-box-containing protein